MLDKIRWVTPGEWRWVASRNVKQEVTIDESSGELAQGTPKKDQNHSEIRNQQKSA